MDFYRNKIKLSVSYEEGNYGEFNFIIIITIIIWVEVCVTVGAPGVVAICEIWYFHIKGVRDPKFISISLQKAHYKIYAEHRPNIGCDIGLSCLCLLLTSAPSISG